MAWTRRVGDLRASNILVRAYSIENTECPPITVVIEYGSRIFWNFFRALLHLELFRPLLNFK